MNFKFCICKKMHFYRFLHYFFFTVNCSIAIRKTKPFYLLQLICKTEIMSKCVKLHFLAYSNFLEVLGFFKPHNSVLTLKFGFIFKFDIWGLIRIILAQKLKIKILGKNVILTKTNNIFLEFGNILNLSLDTYISNNMGNIATNSCI